MCDCPYGKGTFQNVGDKFQVRLYLKFDLNVLKRAISILLPYSYFNYLNFLADHYKLDCFYTC